LPSNFQELFISWSLRSPNSKVWYTTRIAFLLKFNGLDFGYQ